MASAAALSEQELSFVTGAGLAEGSVEPPGKAAEEPAGAAILPEGEPSLPPEDPLAADPPAEQLALTGKPLPPEEAALTGTTPPAADTLPPDPTEPVSPGDEADQTLEIIEPLAEGMVLQSIAYSCGPAALATLLKNLSGRNYYRQIMQIVQLDEQGSSMLALKQAALALDERGFSLCFSHIPALFFHSLSDREIRQ